MKLSVKIFFKDLFAVVLLGAVAAGFGYLFYKDINRSLSNTDGKTLGIVKESTNQPKRKFTGRTLWGSLETGSPIYENDTVKTFDNDSITIQLDDGTELILEPNSMILIAENSITFSEGTLSAVNRSGSSGLSIKTEDGSTLSLTQGVVNLKENAEGKLNLTVSEGSASLTSTSGNSALIGDNESVTFDQQGVNERIQYNLKPLFPPQQTVFVSYADSQQIPFRWEESTEQEGRQLLVSKSSIMSDPLYLEEPEGTEQILDLPPGTYYWQVVSGEEQSGVSRFTLLQERPPLPERPLPDQEFPYRSAPPRIGFQWSASEYALTYSFQLSESETFAETLIDQQIVSNFYFADDLEEGDYWWRIAPRLPAEGGAQLAFTEAQHFRVFRNLQMENTRLLFPADQAVFSPIATSDGMRFSWRSDRDGARYQWTLSRNSDLSDPLYSQELEDRFTYLENLSEGQYFWQVQGWTFDGLPLPDSPVQSFQISSVQGSLSLVSPVRDAALQRSVAEIQRFNWESAEQGFFRFQLWYSADGSSTEDLIADNLTQNRSILNVLPGKGSYRWKVSMVDDQGDILDESSERYFVVQPPFEGPEIVSPAPNAELTLIGQATLNLEWQAQEEADRFDLALRELGTNRIVLQRRNLLETSLEVEDLAPFSEGNYQLEIQSFRNNAPAGFPVESTTSRSAFSIGNLRIYQAPLLSQPRVNQRISYLEVLRSGLTLRWQQNPPLDTYTVRLYGSADNPLPLKSVVTNQTSYRFDSLEPGVYYWEVLASDTAGYQAPLPDRHRFDIESIEDLNRPVLTEPASDSVVDMTERNTLDLRWSASPGAETYRVSLYNSQGDLVFQNNQVEENRLVIDDLTLLDVGQFSLEIQAEAFYEDLNLTRQSLPYRGRFTIELNQNLETPEIITSDVQYTE